MSVVAIILLTVVVAQVPAQRHIPIYFPTDLLRAFNIMISSPRQEPPAFEMASDKMGSDQPRSISNIGKSLDSSNASPPRGLTRSFGLPFDENHEDYVKKEMPPCAKESNFGLCEEDSEYDANIQERFKRALEKIDISEKAYETILSKIMVDDTPPITARIGGGEYLEDPVCPAQNRVVFPQRGMTSSNEWVYVLNQGKMNQGLKFEECVNASGNSLLRSSSSFTCSISTEPGIESVCRQKHIYRKMITMDASGSNIVTESILVPSCCACLRTRNVARIGGGGGLLHNEVGNPVASDSLEPPRDIDEQSFFDNFSEE